MRPDPLAEALMKHHPEYYTGPVEEPAPEPTPEPPPPPKPTPPPTRDVLDLRTKITIPQTSSQRIFDVVARISTTSSIGAVTVRDIKSARRHKKIVYWRQIAFYLMKKHTNLSYPHIGKLVGGRDHSTVHHGVSKIESNYKTYEFHIQLAERLI